MRRILIGCLFCQALLAAPTANESSAQMALSVVKAIIDESATAATQVQPLLGESVVPQLAKTMKDYWFLITLLLSAAASLFYMAVYQVTPLDKYREIRNQREEANFHSDLGYTLLERGEHELAKIEFENSIALKPSNHAALNGRYLAQLFIDADSPQWNPAIGAAIREQLERLPAVKGRNLQHIIEKYSGDVKARIGELDFARQHYTKALSLKASYLSALFTFGWFNYSQGPDLPKMESLFRKMTEIDTYDYRGFHGLGYALYMRAVAATQRDQYQQLINEAAQQSQKASRLTISILNVVADFGEIARCISPGLSLWYHRRGIEIIDDPAAWSVKDNSAPYVANLLVGTGYVYIKNVDQKRAWLIYSLALDHLALSRLGTDSARNLREHDLLKERAIQLDPRKDERATLELYNDQFAILDKFIPVQNAKGS